jgi:hypothetical protein
MRLIGFGFLRLSLRQTRIRAFTMTHTVPQVSLELRFLLV